MKVKEFLTSELKEYENNPRFNSRAVEPVAESIKQFGFKVPIIIDSDNTIVAGHTRLKAAKLLGLEKVPCIVADDLTAEQIQAFRLADNKTGELAEWDMEKLEQELAAMTDIDMEAFGFDENIFDSGLDTDFELPNEDKPLTRTITLSLSEEQYQICEGVMDYFADKDLQHTFGNKNEKSNALFEAVFAWAEQRSLI